MRVIITGGSGMIGRALVGNLATEGHEVIILSRSPGRVSGLPANARAVGWDTRSADGWGELVNGSTAIVNLAGESIGGDRFIPDRWTAEKRRRIRQSRLEAGQAVVDAVAHAEVKPLVVVQSSGIDYYGAGKGDPIAEEAPPGDSFLASVAVDWEGSTAQVEEYGVRRAILRSGIVLSTEGGMMPRVTLPYRLFVGGPFGSGKQWWSWIHLQDEVRAIRFLIERADASGPFNLVAPEPLPSSVFGKTIGEVLGRPHYFPVPGFALRAVLGEVATLVLDGRRVVPERLQELGFEFRFPTLERALHDLLAKA